MEQDKMKKQMQDNLREQLSAIRKRLLDNSVDKQEAVKITEELSQITLLIVSFEFSQNMLEDPEFVETLIAEAKAKKEAKND